MDQDFHLIERYFKGELTEEELNLFHTKLQSDSAFEQEFRDMKLVREGAKASARAKALNVLQAAEANLTEKETTKINVSMKRLVSIAASLIIIATVSYFAISDRTGGTMTGEEVFTAYYEPYPNIVSGKVRGESMEINTLSARAYDAYDNEDFSKSAQLFSELLNVEKVAENYFYSGIANLELGNFKIAADHFNIVMINFSEFGEQAQWYLALSQINEGKEANAITNLVSLKERSADLKSKAESVLKSLEFDSEVKPGEVEEETTIPPINGNNEPSGLIEESQYQYGIINDGSSKINFFNDYPIEGLKVGDQVEFMLIKTRRGQSIAVIVDRIE